MQAATHRLQRAALIAGMLLGAMNVWTGVPVLGLWVGSRLVRSGNISMLAVLVALATMAAAAWIVLTLISAMDARLRGLDGRARVVHQQLPWLRSMRGERPHQKGDERGLDTIDYVLIAVVFVAVVCFEVWFFFFSTSPIDGRSGRG